MSYDPVLFCFGGIPWNNQWKRNQSMVSHLVKNNIFKEAYYVNPGVWLRNGRWEKIEPMVPGVEVIQPVHFIPFKKGYPTPK